jgi:hypothetical protein
MVTRNEYESALKKICRHGDLATGMHAEEMEAHFFNYFGFSR